MIKGIAFRWRIPYVGVNHLAAHLLAIQVEHQVSLLLISHCWLQGATTLLCCG